MQRITSIYLQAPQPHSAAGCSVLPVLSAALTTEPPCQASTRHWAHSGNKTASRVGGSGVQRGKQELVREGLQGDSSIQGEAIRLGGMPGRTGGGQKTQARPGWGIPAFSWMQRGVAGGFRKSPSVTSGCQIIGEEGPGQRITTGRWWWPLKRD